MKHRRSPSFGYDARSSPGIAKAVVWVGLGAVALSRGIGWWLQRASVRNSYIDSNQSNIPMMITMLMIAFS